jgi:transposase
VEKKLSERLKSLGKTWQNAKPIKLMFQDEARFGRITDPRRCWAPKPMRPICQAMMVRQYTYTYSAVDVQTGQLDSLILPQANTQCMQLFVDEVARRHSEEHIVMVVDGASWHRSEQLRVPENMRLLSLPPYAPELNPVEHLWDELREKHFHNRVFNSLSALEDHLEMALKSFEMETELIRSIVAWPWIINALFD